MNDFLAASLATRFSPMPPRDHRLYPRLAVLAGAIVVFRLALAQPTFSPALDESSYAGSGVSMIEARKLIAPGQHPPLTKLVVALPLWLDGCRLPQCRGQVEIASEDLGYKLGTQILYDGPKPFQTLLAHARLTMLIFPAIALLYVYLFGRWIGGGRVGLAAVLFFSVDPTFLGQGLWLGADVAGCAGFLAGIYHGLRWLWGGTWKQAAIAGVAIGLAISAKFSCFLLLPALAAAGAAGWIWNPRSVRFSPSPAAPGEGWGEGSSPDSEKSPLPDPLLFEPEPQSRRPEYRAREKSWGRLVGQIAAVGVIAALLLWATYFFNIGHLSDQQGLTGPTTHLTPEAAGFRRSWDALPHWVREAAVPMPSFFLAMARLIGHGQNGHDAYLNGRTRTTGWWYYFPELLLVKSTLGFLIALALAFCAGSWRGWPMRATLIPAAVFLAPAMAGRIDIGIRHILPLIPLLYLFTAWRLMRPGWVWALALLIGVSAVETAAVHPDYLSFFNVAAGGPGRGDRFALDSNLDWNQDVIRLAQWLKAHAGGRPYAIRLSGQRNKPLLRSLGVNADALDAPPHGGWLCISKNVRLMIGALPWLENYVPVAHIGYSIDVYDLSGPRRGDEPDDVPMVDDPSAVR